MKLIQRVAECSRNIVGNSLEIILAIGLACSAVGCKSLDDIVIDNYKIPRRELIVIEKSIGQDFGRLSGEYVPKYNTITHRLLQMEKDFGADSGDYYFLDNLIAEAESKIDIKKTYNKTEAIEALQTIGEILKPFQKEPKKIRSSLLNQCFEDKLLDCDSLSLVYLAIGEVINLPLKLAVIPRHAFIRVYTKEGSFNWDSAMSEDDKIISNKKYVGEENINNWPKTLDTPNVFGLHHINRSSEWLNKYYYSEWQKNNGINVDEKEKLFYLEKGLENVDKAIKLFPESFSAYFNKGDILFYMKDYNNSLEAFTKADSLWKNNAEVLVWQGKIYYQFSKHDKALDLLNLAIEINPYLEEAYKVRSDIWKKKGDERKALDDLMMAINLYQSRME